MHQNVTLARYPGLVNPVPAQAAQSTQMSLVAAAATAMLRCQGSNASGRAMRRPRHRRRRPGRLRLPPPRPPPPLRSAYHRVHMQCILCTGRTEARLDGLFATDNIRRLAMSMQHAHGPSRRCSCPAIAHGVSWNSKSVQQKCSATASPGQRMWATSHARGCAVIRNVKRYDMLDTVNTSYRKMTVCNAHLLLFILVVLSPCQVWPIPTVHPCLRCLRRRRRCRRARPAARSSTCRRCFSRFVRVRKVIFYRQRCRASAVSATIEVKTSQRIQRAICAACWISGGAGVSGVRCRAVIVVGAEPFGGACKHVFFRSAIWRAAGAVLHLHSLVDRTQMVRTCSCRDSHQSEAIPGSQTQG